MIGQFGQTCIRQHRKHLWQARSLVAPLSDGNNAMPLIPDCPLRDMFLGTAATWSEWPLPSGGHLMPLVHVCAVCSMLWLRS